jgi:hypothetical protein
MQDLRFSRRWLWRMTSSVRLHCVALIRFYVSKVLSASFIRVIRLGELGTTLGVIRNRRTLRRNTKAHLAPSSSETSVLTKATRRNIPEDGFRNNDNRIQFPFTNKSLKWDKMLRQCISIGKLALRHIRGWEKMIKYYGLLCGQILRRHLAKWN